ncbi:MAG TPA: glycosyltransferase family 4 protein [Gammaproteobacteria bacterium]|nr:glycosyltransferase family 4 protein [Gammaproteobacteria bacterium]
MASLTVMQLLPALESGGVERGTVDVARELVRRGHRALVVSAGGPMVQELHRAGAEHIEWPIGRKSLFTLRWVRPLRRLMLEQNVDILHLRSRLPAWVGYLAWRGLPSESRPRLVTTVHGFYTVGRYSAVMTRGERVIAVSESVRDYIFANYPHVAPERVTVIHRGVDTDRYPYGYRPPADWLEAWHRRHPQLRDRFVVTLPARVTRWKGQAHFIEVIAGLRERGVPVHGLIVGGAHPRKRAYLQELERKVAEAGLSDTITFTGHRGDLREILAVSDVVVSLSTDPEAFGRTTIEALSLGTPVAGYDHGGVGEQLRVVLPAGLVPVGDRKAMADLLARWYEQPPAVAPTHPFTLRAMLTATVGVYEALSSARAGADDRSPHLHSRA